MLHCACFRIMMVFYTREDTVKCIPAHRTKSTVLRIKQYQIPSLARNTTNRETEVLDLSLSINRSIYFLMDESLEQVQCVPEILPWKWIPEDLILTGSLHITLGMSNMGNCHSVQLIPPKSGWDLIPVITVSILKKEKGDVIRLHYIAIIS